MRRCRHRRLPSHGGRLPLESGAPEARRGWAGVGLHQVGDIPQDHAAIVGGRGQAGAIGGEGDGKDCIRMTADQGDFPTAAVLLIP